MRCAARLCVLIEENRMEVANKIAIITDTCCDLPQEYLKEYPNFLCAAGGDKRDRELPR